MLLIKGPDRDLLKLSVKWPTGPDGLQRFCGSDSDSIHNTVNVANEFLDVLATKVLR